MVRAHLAALEQAPEIGFGRYIISATTPFASRELAELRTDTPAVVKRYVPDFVTEYARRGWRMHPTIDRVYVNQKTRADLGWKPKYDFRFLIEQLKAGEDTRSPLARLVGSKGYHAEVFADGPYPTEGVRS